MRGLPPFSTHSGKIGLSLALACCWACGGNLYIVPSGADAPATDPDTVVPCSPEHVDGTCDVGICLNGACYVPGEHCCTGCAAAQGCIDCACVDIDDGNRCSADHLAGACPNGEVCVAGHCAPPTCGAGVGGCCASGLACVSGQCVSVIDRLCALFPEDGLCPTGEECHAGTCEPVACAPGVCGSCVDADFGCGPDGCEQLPCSPEHATGFCDSDLQFCSVCGTCTYDGMCCDQADCTVAAFSKCSVLSQCIPPDECLAPADCTGADEYCCSLGRCTADTACCAAADCLPGHNCVGGACTRVGPACTTNDHVANVEITSGNWRCDSSQLYCCPTGEVCCPAGQHCRTADALCLSVGTCIDDSDCPTGLSCNADAHVCEAIDPCPTEGCVEGERCSLTNSCLPETTCAVEEDCPAGMLCNGKFACETDCRCGCTNLGAQRILPDVLMLLDRSTSMTTVITGSTATRWQTALDAIDLLMTTYTSDIRFGVGTFPKRCPTNACVDGCPDYTCASFSQNCEKGGVNVPVDALTQTAIHNYLAADCPGGSTPTGPTLKNIHGDPVGAGLADPDRSNSIVLVTDGDANCDPQCNSSVDTAAPLVYTALDDLRTLDPSVRTYTIGFGFRSARLNCYAVHGGTSRCATDNALCSGRSTATSCRNDACTWTAGGTCVGNTDVCAMLKTSTDCGNSGCSWTGSPASCKPNDAACAGFTTAAACQARCAWLTQGGCYGADATCAVFSDEPTCGLNCSWSTICQPQSTTCATYTAAGEGTCVGNGCVWSGSACVGDTTACNAFATSGPCNARCVWDGAAATHCKPNDTVCNAITSSGSCNSGCVWIPRCDGNDTACALFTDSTACGAGGCTWDGSKCVGDDTDCTTRGTSNSTKCRAACLWSGTCIGDNSICNPIHDSTTCTNTGCRWTSESTCVGDNATCGTITAAAACAPRCTYTGSCQGDTTTCGANGTQAQCLALCSWSNYCTGYDTSCATFTAAGATACTAAGCSWTGTACTGNDAACANITVDTRCRARCRWENSACTGDDAACAPYNSGNCSGSGCSWVASNSCTAVDALTCPYAGTCYYNADDEASLNQALNDIAIQVAACTYGLNSTTVDLNNLYVFLDYGTNPLPAACRGQNPCPLTTGSDTWTADPVTMSVNFLGAACVAIQDDVAIPLIVAGCSVGGG